MTPNPPPSSDGSSALPPRTRPNMASLSKDTTEQDLWAFDNVRPPEEEEIIKPPEPKPQGFSIPAPRDGGSMKIRPQFRDAAPSKSAGANDAIKVNVGKSRPKLPTGNITGPTISNTDFDDLDNWDEPEEPQPEAPKRVPTFQKIAPPPAPEPVAEVIALPPASAPPAEENVDEFSPVVPANATPVSLRPRLNLSGLERIGLVALLGVLVIGGGVVCLNSIGRLPTGSSRLKANDFPVAGKHLTILSAESHWRAPRATDTVRRDTQLIPVINLISSGNPAAVRVFFRNSNGDVIGDAVTRLVSPGAELQIAATAGFDDVGMHAAYRTDQGKPWTIDVFEAPSENSPGPEFKKLFEMTISPDRR